METYHRLTSVKMLAVTIRWLGVLLPFTVLSINATFLLEEAERCSKNHRHSHHILSAPISFRTKFHTESYVPSATPCVPSSVRPTNSRSLSLKPYSYASLLSLDLEISRCR